MPLNAKEIDLILAQSGNPELARSQWEGFQAPVDFSAQPGSAAFLSLFGNSRPFMNWIARRPDLIQPLLSSSILFQKKPLLELTAEWHTFLTSSQGNDDFKQTLRHFRHREMMRLMIRELAQLGDYESIGQEIANLAQVTQEAALSHALAQTKKIHGTPQLARQHLECGFSVVGLGKLGGEDLNFSSDIDVLFLYDSDSGQCPSGASLHEFANQLFQLSMDLLQKRTEDGFVFRVDTDLRPEGKSGTLSNSLDAVEDYYENWGANWERAALLKARPVAGTRHTALDFLKRVFPFVYRQTLDTSVLTELKEMKNKINQDQKKRLKQTFNVKLGEGGIREIEFFVAIFQLLYGGKQPALRPTQTLRALQALGERGIITLEDAAHLRTAYIFLRRIENRLQILDDQQTHQLPAEPKELLALARRMNCPSVDEFQDQLQQTRKIVSDHFQHLNLT